LDWRLRISATKLERNDFSVVNFFDIGTPPGSTAMVDTVQPQGYFRKPIGVVVPFRQPGLAHGFHGFVPK